MATTWSLRGDSSSADAALRKAESRFSKLGKATVVANQALELGAKAAAALQKAYQLLDKYTLQVARATAKLGDNLAKNSRALGEDTVFMQVWAAAAQEAGVREGGFEKAVLKANKVVSDADQGLTTYVELLGKMDISHRKASGELKTGTELLEDMADAFQSGVIPEGQQAALVMQLLGDRTGRMAGFLRNAADGVEKASDRLERYNTIMTPELLALSENYTDSVQHLGEAKQGLANALSIELLPVMVEFNETLAEAIGESDGLSDGIAGITKDLGEMAIAIVELKDAIGPVVGVFTKNFTDMAEDVGWFVQSLKDANHWLKMQSPGHYGENIQDLTNFTYDLIEANKQLVQDQRDMWGPLEDELENGPGGGGDGARTAGKEAGAAWVTGFIEGWGDGKVSLATEMQIEDSIAAMERRQRAAVAMEEVTRIQATGTRDLLSTEELILEARDAELEKLEKLYEQGASLLAVDQARQAVMAQSKRLLAAEDQNQAAQRTQQIADGWGQAAQAINTAGGAIRALMSDTASTKDKVLAMMQSVLGLIAQFGGPMGGAIGGVGSAILGLFGGVGDRGMWPEMIADRGSLPNTGLHHTIVKRRDEMVLDPVGTTGINDMIRYASQAMQRQARGGRDLTASRGGESMSARIPVVIQIGSRQISREIYADLERDTRAGRGPLSLGALRT